MPRAVGRRSGRPSLSHSGSHEHGPPACRLLALNRVVPQHVTAGRRVTQFGSSSQAVAPVPIRLGTPNEVAGHMRGHHGVLASQIICHPLVIEFSR